MELTIEIKLTDEEIQALANLVVDDYPQEQLYEQEAQDLYHSWEADPAAAREAFFEHAKLSSITELLDQLTDG